MARSDEVRKQIKLAIEENEAENRRLRAALAALEPETAVLPAPALIPSKPMISALLGMDGVREVQEAARAATAPMQAALAQGAMVREATSLAASQAAAVEAIGGMISTHIRKRRTQAELDRARVAAMRVMLVHGGQIAVPDLHRELLQRGEAENTKSGMEATRNLLRGLEKAGRVRDLGRGMFGLTPGGFTAAEEEVSASASDGG